MNVLLQPTALIPTILFAWGLLVLLSTAAYRRRRGYPLLRRSIYPGLPYTSNAEARQRAEDRRVAVERALREREGQSPVAVELLEMPEGSSRDAVGILKSLDFVKPIQFATGFRQAGRLSRLPEINPAAICHTAKLNAQLYADEYLLAERVTDLLIRLQRSEAVDRATFPNCVRVEPIDIWWWELSPVFLRVRGWALALRQRLARHRADSRRQEPLFPWRVVIETEHPEKLATLLQPFRRWLGIGIDFLRPTEVKPQGGCQTNNGIFEGMLGGIVRDEMGQRFGVTCHHVVSPKCLCLAWPKNEDRPRRQYTTELPDAVFLDLTSPCFLLPGQACTMMQAASAGDLRAARDGNVPLTKSPDRDGVPAVAQSLWVSEFRMGDCDYLNQHVLLVPRTTKRFWIHWPLWPRHFSRPGDSGAAVIDDRASRWLGIVIGSAEGRDRQSYVIPAELLLEVFNSARNTAASNRVEVLI